MLASHKTLEPDEPFLPLRSPPFAQRYGGQASGDFSTACIARSLLPIYCWGMRFKEYLLSMGYRPFCGQVDAEVFAFFHCPHAERAVWYVNRAMCSFQCMGCPEQCETDDPRGFQPFLPLDDDPPE